MTQSALHVFQSPALLANWVRRFVLDARPIESDRGLVPDAKTSAELKIAATQTERCMREYSVLRVAGVSAFVRRQYPDQFQLAFGIAMVGHLCEHIFGDNAQDHASEMAEALDGYIAATLSNDVDQCAQLYMRRVYDDSENFYKLALGGVGFVSCKFIADTYELFRDVHSRVTEGMSYDQLQVLLAAAERIHA